METHDVGVPRCLLCGSAGESEYTGVTDRLFGVPGAWDIQGCERCEVSWLSPRPRADEVPELYVNYFTHDEIPQAVPRRLRSCVDSAIRASALGYRSAKDETWFRAVGWLAARLEPLRTMSGMRIMYLDGRRVGRLLDVGCGDGTFASQMQKLGWDVMGIEPDAAAAARVPRSIPVVVGTIESASLSAGAYDAITLRHVIEHTVDPVAGLEACHRALKPGGTITIAAPNRHALGHRLFRESWRGLEVPRHT